MALNRYRRRFGRIGRWLALALLVAQFGAEVHLYSHPLADPAERLGAARSCGTCLASSQLQNAVAAPLAESSSLKQPRPMPKLDTYLFREFAQATFAALVVLMVVSLGGVFADVLKDIAGGKVPAGMMLAQLGLQLLNYLPLILPLGLMLGLLLAVGRLYRDAEMPIFSSIGVGPRRLLRPLLMLVVPVVADKESRRLIGVIRSERMLRSLVAQMAKR